MTDLNLNPINSVAKKSKGVKGKRILKLRHIEHPKIAAIGDSSVFGVGDHGGHLPAVGPGWVRRLAHDLLPASLLTSQKMVLGLKISMSIKSMQQLQCIQILHSFQ